MNRVIVSLVIAALVAAMVPAMSGCGPSQYTLTISSTQGGRVIDPGEGVFYYDEGTEVNLLAQADVGYHFVTWTGDVGTLVDVNAASTKITMTGVLNVIANFDLCQPIYDWYDLDSVRDNLSGSYVLMTDLDSTTAGYEELAGPTADNGKGWKPIATVFASFTGTFDGRGYEIRDLFVGRPTEVMGGLFGSVGAGGVIENVCVVNADVTGGQHVGGLVAKNWGTVSNACFTGSVAGWGTVGGLVGYNAGGYAGYNWEGTVSNSYSIANVSGERSVGGLVGYNWGGTVSNSYYNYDEVLINGENIITIGALFGEDFDEWLTNQRFLDIDERLSHEDGYYLVNDVDDLKRLLAFGQDGALRFRLGNNLDLSDDPNLYIPYFAGEFDGSGRTISNLSFNFDSVSQVGLFGYLASGGRVSNLGVENADITGSQYVGGLVAENWQGTVNNSYSTGSVTGHKHALSPWAVGGLVGHTYGGSVSNSYSTATVTGELTVGGLVGWNGHGGTVSNSYSSGNVTGESSVGGLVGLNDGPVNNSYSTGTVTGDQYVGGLTGHNRYGPVCNSHYNFDEVLINGQNVITIGALFGEDFDEWLANERLLDVDEKLSQEDGYYLIDDVDDFKQLLAFGQDGTLRFRLGNNLDLSDDPNLYIPYFAGEFDGNGRTISNLSFNLDSVSQVGLFGYLASGGVVSNLGVENIDMAGHYSVGGLVGHNRWGTVNNSYSSGNVTGKSSVGGLVGHTHGGSVNDSYSTASVNGEDTVGGLVGDNWGTLENSYAAGTATGNHYVGGLVGTNGHVVSNSYSSGCVTGDSYVGGLVGFNWSGTVTGSFWDVEASGIGESDGGTGKTTAEMRSISTFLLAVWEIVAVADLGQRNMAYTWNIVDGETYPFLSWQPVS